MCSGALDSLSWGLILGAATLTAPGEHRLKHIPCAQLTVLVGFGPYAAAFGHLAAVGWAHGLEKKTALRDMCTCLFVGRLGDKYALIMLCVAEGVLQFMVP